MTYMQIGASLSELLVVELARTSPTGYLKGLPIPNLSSGDKKHRSNRLPTWPNKFVGYLNVPLLYLLLSGQQLLYLFFLSSRLSLRSCTHATLLLSGSLAQLLGSPAHMPVAGRTPARCDPPPPCRLTPPLRRSPSRRQRGSSPSISSEDGPDKEAMVHGGPAPPAALPPWHVAR
jgi:hypothetical protein